MRRLSDVKMGFSWKNSSKFGKRRIGKLHVIRAMGLPKLRTEAFKYRPNWKYKDEE